MGLAVEEATPSLVRLAFPLAPNHNHKNTAFGGSLYCAGVTAAWSLLWCALRESGLKAQVVVASSTERFLRPAAGDFTAECTAADGALHDALVQLRSEGKAKLRLKSRVLCGDDVCVAFEGTFALIG